MTNQNLPCPFCHKPMQDHDSFMGAKLKEVYCDNDNCLIMGRLFDKELMNNRQPHPLEKEVEEYELALQRACSKNVALKYKIEAFKMRLTHEIYLLKMNTPAPGPIEKPENYYVKAYEQILKGVTELFGEK